MAPIILYDNPSQAGTCWSCNVWKTRLLLNFKCIPYETKFIEGNVREIIKNTGVSAHPEGTQISPFTIPTVEMPDGTVLMESDRIAKAIEQTWPVPNVHLGSVELRTAKKGWVKAIVPLQPVTVPRMPVYALREPTASYHREARRETYGMSLEEYEAKYGGEKCWEKAKEGFKIWVDLLNTDDSGPFCMGKEVSYADFWIVGFFEWLRSLKGDCFDRAMQFDPSFPRLYKACSVWLERNDH